MRPLAHGIFCSGALHQIFKPVLSITVCKFSSFLPANLPHKPQKPLFRTFYFHNFIEIKELHIRLLQSGSNDENAIQAFKYFPYKLLHNTCAGNFSAFCRVQ